MQAGEETWRAGPQMGRKAQIECAGESRDLHCLADATAKGRVGLEHIHGFQHRQIAEIEACRLAFACRDRHGARGPHLRHARLVVADHSLEPGEISPRRGG
jgi:hypothetical protein